MSIPSTGYRGSQIFNVNGTMQNMLTSDAVYSDYLHIMGGDVAATLAWLRDLGITPPGMPTPSLTSPLNTTQSVIQDPAFAPGTNYVYQNTSIEFYTNGGTWFIQAFNEVPTGIQPTLMQCMITSPACIMLNKAEGSSGMVATTMYGQPAGKQIRVYVGGLIIGRSRFSYWNSYSQALGVPSISNTNGTIKITAPLSISGANIPGTKLEWRKKNANWTWQPYVGPFTKPAGGGYTIQVRALRYGLNDSNSNAELAIA